MSERQAKIKRKNVVSETPKKKKSAVDIVSNIIIVLLILAVLGIGGWAVYSKYNQMPVEQDISTMTLAEYAYPMGLEVDEFLAQYDLKLEKTITEESLISDIIPLMTLANYAKFTQTDVLEIKETLGLGADFPEERTMGEIFDALETAMRIEDQTQQDSAESAE